MKVWQKDTGYMRGYFSKIQTIIYFLLLFCIAEMEGYYDTYACNYEWYGAVDFICGYRQDIMKNLVQGCNSEGVRFKDFLEVDPVYITEYGISGEMACENWFAEGFVTFGNINGGKYHETFQICSGEQLETRSCIRGCGAVDFSLGFGYLYPFGSDFQLGPVVGWSYDYLNIKLNDPKTNGECDPLLKDLSYFMRWQGPWLGLETLITFYEVEFNLGYQYHFPNWTAQWQLAGKDTPEAFSDRRKAQSGSGNLLFLDMNIEMYSGWSIGSGIRYQSWIATDGNLKSKKGREPVDHVPYGKWRSLEGRFTVGYHY